MRDVDIMKPNVGPDGIDNTGARDRPVQSREIWIQELRCAQVELGDIQLEAVKFGATRIENIDRLGLVIEGILTSCTNT